MDSENSEAERLREIIQEKERTIKLLCEHCSFIKDHFTIILKSIYDSTSDTEVRNVALRLKDKLEETDFNLV